MTLFSPGKELSESHCLLEEVGRYSGAQGVCGGLQVRNRKLVVEVPEVSGRGEHSLPQRADLQHRQHVADGNEAAEASETAFSPVTPSPVAYLKVLGRGL